MHFLVRDTLQKHIEALPTNKLAYFTMATVFYFLFEIASLITFNTVNGILTPESTTVIGYQTNFEQGGCGKMQMRNSLQTSCLNGCAVVTLPVVAYLSTLYNPIKFQDQANFGLRLSLLALFALVSHIPV